MFFLAKYQHAIINVAEPEFYEMTEGEAAENGEALVLSAGKLTKCGATQKPEYIAMVAMKKDASARRMPVVRADENQIWRVPVNADPTALVPGAKVTLGGDALTVTATTTSGVVTVYDTAGAKKAGDEIYVRIV
jgi:hypothetical protein